MIKAAIQNENKSVFPNQGYNSITFIPPLKRTTPP